MGGPLDVVDHARNGHLFDPAVRGDLARWVTELVESPRLREAMGAAGPLRVVDRSWDSLTAQLVGHYESAIATALPATPDGDITMSAADARP